MKKPYVIIHTLTSLDGRIHNIELPEFDSAALQYEQLALHAGQHVAGTCNLTRVSNLDVR